MLWCIGVVFISALVFEGDAKYNRVCYYTNWSQYRPNEGRFVPADIEADLCTHLIYAFGVLEDNQLKTYEWNDEQLYKEFNGIKAQNPNIKTLLAIGGWNAASKEFTKTVSSEAYRKEFIDQSIVFLRKYNFDGLDLDWEYPAYRGGVPSDKKNFGILCQELRAAYEKEAQLTGKERLLVTAAVAAGQGYVDTGYDVPVMAQNLDFISLMSYDLHGSWDPITGHNSPLYSSSTESSDQQKLNIKWAAEYWASKGCPKKKLNIGLATYGRTFTLTDTTRFGLGAPASGGGTAGTYTREKGFLSYYEICLKQVSGQGQTYLEDEQKVPYYVNGNLWVGFDDEASIAIKVSWLVNEGYAGAMVWALPLDDFDFICPSSNITFPLTRRMAKDLIAAEGGQPLTTQTAPKPTTVSTSTAHVSNSQQTTTPASTSAQMTTKLSTILSTLKTTTTGGGTDFSCSGRPDGNYPDTSDCSKFIVCSHGNLYRKDCLTGLLWNPIAGICDWPRNVQCNVVSTNNPQTTTLPSTSTNPPQTTTLPSTSTNPPQTTTLPSTSTNPPETTTLPTTSTEKVTTAPVQTTKQTPTQQQTTTTQPVTTDFSCVGKVAGNYPHPSDCTKYIACTAAEVMYEGNCPPNQYWNPARGYCDWTYNVQCNNPPTTDQSVFSCHGKTNGNYPDTTDCSKYIVCLHGKKYLRSCNSQTLWNKNRGYCDWPRNVQC